MRLFHRKSNVERLLDTVGEVLDTPSGSTMKRGLMIAGGIAGLAVGSAGISSLRRHNRGAGGNS